MIRLFVALRPPLPIRQSLLPLCSDVENARWQDDSQLHLTLRFIGDVDERGAEDIALALSRVRSAPFHLSLAGVGQFEKKGTVDTLWAGVTPHDAVSALHHKINRALETIGIAPEMRAFLPHITLARLNRSAGPVTPFLAENLSLHSAPWPVAEFSLYESQMGKSGSHYRECATYPLG